MDIKELKENIKQALAPNINDPSKVAGYLSVAGEDVVDQIYDDVKASFDRFPSASPFAIAIPETMIWAFYATRDNEFFRLTIEYLENGSEDIFSQLEKFQHRYEVEKTEGLLKSWKQIFDKYNLKQMSGDYTIDNLLTYQEKLIPLVSKYPFIGAWTILSPFKALICYQPRQFKDVKLNKLMMPMGSQVVKGIYYLRRLGFSVPLIEQDDESNIGTVYEVQAFQIDLAKKIDSNVLFINSGLYKLGKGEEK